MSFATSISCCKTYFHEVHSIIAEDVANHEAAAYFILTVDCKCVVVNVRDPNTQTSNSTLKACNARGM
jgi:hypothetical protein